MDASWSYADWKPTTMQWVEGHPPNQAEVEALRDDLQRQARNLAELPFQPELYNLRGNTLLRLGYPELAAMDVHKCIILCNAGLNEGDPKLGEDVRRQLGMSLWCRTQTESLWNEDGDAVSSLIFRHLKELRKLCYSPLSLALFSMQALPGAIEVCQGGLLKYPSDEGITQALNLAKRQYSSIEARGHDMSKIPWGIIKHNEYPWTPAEMRTRSKATIAAAKTEFRSCSANLEIKKTSLISRSSGVAHEPLGIFATQIIKKGQRLFASTSALKVSDKQASGSCYNCDFPLYLLATHNIATFHCCPDMQFCGKQCLDIAQSRYHKTLCGKDFGDIHRAKGCEGIDSRFALRLLAFIVQNGEHPLNIPEMTWITPPCPGTEVRATLAGSILEPLRILQGLGADIFDPKYEKWVLQTVWNRADNNVRGCWDERTSSGHRDLDFMYSFFNHSCKPNAAVTADREVRCPSRTFLTASRGIKAGEEVCISYLEEPERMPRDERQNQLKKWVGEGGCQCAECKERV